MSIFENLNDVQKYLSELQTHANKLYSNKSIEDGKQAKISILKMKEALTELRGNILKEMRDQTRPPKRPK